MNTNHTQASSTIQQLTHLRTHDVIAKLAHVSYRQTARVLIALRAVSIELEMTADQLLALPMPRDRPTPAQSQACSAAFLRICDTDSMRKYLYAIEQFA